MSSMTITLDDELVERAAEQVWHRTAPSHAIEWADESHRAEYFEVARAAITAYLQGAVEAGKATYHEGVPTQHGLLGIVPHIILPLPPQNASGAESSTGDEQARDNDA
jgi:hypothetical protein